jgi:hypothetical protein
VGSGVESPKHIIIILNSYLPERAMLDLREGGAWETMMLGVLGESPDLETKPFSTKKKII